MSKILFRGQTDKNKFTRSSSRTLDYEAHDFGIEARPGQIIFISHEAKEIYVVVTKRMIFYRIPFRTVNIIRW